MSYRLGYLGATTVISVTSTTPSSGTRFTPNGIAVATYRYMLTASADTNIVVNADATTTTALLKANLPYEISLYGTDTLSYVTSATATLFITHIDV